MFEHTPTLVTKLQDAYKSKGADYRPRTRYLDEQQQPLYINRLILEDSPYLLQHAHNPVDWFPWGEEAFTLAREQNKPVFLSIGYSTCHWCHVMEEESFDNEQVAAVMNDLCICIKVDRELHPDVDTYYMTAIMMMQGHGGWPMSSFLTPDRQPFFGGTYFQPGQFISLLRRVSELWQNQHDDLLEQARHFSQQVAGAITAKQSLNEIGINVVDLTAQALMNLHDPQHGGFGQAPKFPNEPYLYFLLDYALFKGDKPIMDAITRTLHIQACGGFYDQIGGGFHRYATDANWLIPHFEKMLYNQANLSYLFAQAWCLTRAKDFKRVVNETLDYVLREMTCPDGGFYSATDADSEGGEGLFFIWDRNEIEALLNSTAEEFIQLYQITDSGNFEGKNIPSLAMPLEQYAETNSIDYSVLIERLVKSKSILLEARAKRIPPLLDDKIITAWNGMMIKTFAYVGQLFERQDYIDAACKAADYVLKNNRFEDGRLSRSSVNGRSSHAALQEDHAYLAEALLQIYDATLDEKWLAKAQQLSDEMINRFWDEDAGGFFMSHQGDNNLLPCSPKEIQDNATASGNSVALKALVRLWRRSGNPVYQNYAQQLIRAFSDDITQRPYICAYLIGGLMELLAGEQGNRQWCCDGNIFLEARLNDLGTEHHELILTVHIADGWHLNDVSTSSEENSPIEIELSTGWRITDVQAPTGFEKQMGYQQQPVTIYEGILNIRCKAENSANGALAFPGTLLKIALHLQACNEKKCLAPETVKLSVPL